MRHSFASHHLNLGTSLKCLSEPLRHASVGATANWCSWAPPSGVRSVADRLAAALGTNTIDLVAARMEKVAVGEPKFWW